MQRNEPKAEQGSLLLWEVLTSLKVGRDLPHFKSEIGDEKPFFKSKTFLALKSEIADTKNPFFLMIKPLFFKN